MFNLVGRFTLTIFRKRRLLPSGGLLLAIALFPAGSLSSNYIDPGTGSIAVQIFLAGIVGALFGIKIFWRKIKARFRELFTRKDS